MKTSILFAFMFFVPVILHSQTMGTKVIGNNSVEETVSSIMARQILGVNNSRSVEAEKEKVYPNRNNLPQNPNSPEVSKYSSNLKISNTPN